MPANLAATLYQKTNGAIEVACINTLGVLYVVENGETVNSVEDLKGKTIVTTGKGTTPEYVLRYILTENGVDPDNDVTLDFYSEATEALAQLQAGTSTIAMLPQPFVTSALAQVEGLRVALDMNEEWEKVAGSKLVTGVLVARKDAVEADPARFAAFMDGYKASVEAANTDLENTAALCEQYGIVAKAALAQKALPNCNIVFETGDEMKTDLKPTSMFCTQLTPPAWAVSSRQMTSTMPAKARNNKTPMWQTLLAVAFWVAVWQGLAVCIGHNGLFLATPANGADLVAAAAHGGFLAQGRVQRAAHFNGLCAGGHSGAAAEACGAGGGGSAPWWGRLCS